MTTRPGCARVLVLLASACSTDGGSDGQATETSASTPTSSADDDGDDAIDDDDGGSSDSHPTSTSSDPSDDGPADSTGNPSRPVLPPADGGLDYQLGTAYTPPRGTQIVARDRNADPEPGLYNICYVNGFQAQPDEARWWLTEYPDLVLRDRNGDPVIDPDWDEMLLDTSTVRKREALAAIESEWIAGCAAAGFDAVEIDNLDSYSRSQDLLTQDDAVAFMSLLSLAAHSEGLPIAQKNSTELVERRREMGTDFAVAEECSRYEECGDYVAGYDTAVLMIEYREQDFTAGCRAYPEMSIVLRDVDLVGPGRGGYVFDAC